MNGECAKAASDCVARNAKCSTRVRSPRSSCRRSPRCTPAAWERATTQLKCALQPQTARLEAPRRQTPTKYQHSSRWVFGCHASPTGPAVPHYGNTKGHKHEREPLQAADVPPEKKYSKKIYKQHKRPTRHLVDGHGRVQEPHVHQRGCKVTHGGDG